MGIQWLLLVWIFLSLLQCRSVSRRSPALFHDRESFLVFRVHEGHGKSQLLHQLVLHVIRVPQSCFFEFFVGASIVSCGLQVDSHSFKVFLHGWICDPCFLCISVVTRQSVELSAHKASRSGFRQSRRQRGTNPSFVNAATYLTAKRTGLRHTEVYALQTILRIEVHGPGAISVTNQACHEDTGQMFHSLFPCRTGDPI